MKRLQRGDWQKYKAKLHMVGYFKSLNGNICGYYAYNGHSKPVFTHWLNTEETILFNTLPHDNIPEMPWKKAKHKTEPVEAT